MTRLITALGLCFALATDAVAQEPILYGWSISLSDTDPQVNVGAPTGAPLDAYLWLAR
ncbi:MAG: hypothetical protein DHS20C21_14770 [Gemmatimonadota bacterium]|nr:MAG: hypothetical protein DHS20C21_14770 [Gemmatimonadota bacterium]